MTGPCDGPVFRADQRSPDLFESPRACPPDFGDHRVPPRLVPITYTDDLIETRFGLYLQGIPPKHVPWRCPLWLIHMIWPGLLANDESVDDLAARVSRPLEQLLVDHPGDGGICVSHGDPIQGFWVKAEHRPRYALHRLQCAKGGLLELDYEGRALRHLSYLPPARVAELAPEGDQTEAGSRSGA